MVRLDRHRKRACRQAQLPLLDSRKGAPANDVCGGTVGAHLGGLILAEQRVVLVHKLGHVAQDLRPAAAKRLQAFKAGRARGAG